MQHRLFYHAIINGSAPQYLIDDLPGHICDRTRYNPRNKDDTNLYNCKTDKLRVLFSQVGLLLKSGTI